MQTMARREAEEAEARQVARDVQRRRAQDEAEKLRKKAAAVSLHHPSVVHVTARAGGKTRNPPRAARPCSTSRRVGINGAVKRPLDRSGSGCLCHLSGEYY